MVTGRGWQANFRDQEVDLSFVIGDIHSTARQ